MVKLLKQVAQFKSLLSTSLELCTIYLRFKNSSQEKSLLFKFDDRSSPIVKDFVNLHEVKTIMPPAFTQESLMEFFPKQVRGAQIWLLWSIHNNRYGQFSNSDDLIIVTPLPPEDLYPMDSPPKAVPVAQA